MTSFKVMNETGQTLTINGQTVEQGELVDLLPIWEYGGIESAENDIEGANKGTALDGTNILDVIAKKQAVSFISQPRPHVDCLAIKRLVSHKPLSVVTDLFTAEEQTYQMFSLERSITQLVNQYCKVSFTLEEV